MIRADRMLFGVVPTLVLQNSILDPTKLHWYDYASTATYCLHALVPLVFALWLWLHDRESFIRYMAAMVLLSYVAFVTYYLWPAAPP